MSLQGQDAIAFVRDQQENAHAERHFQCAEAQAAREEAQHQRNAKGQHRATDD